MIDLRKDLKNTFIIIVIICTCTTLLNVFINNEFTWTLLKDQIFFNLYLGVPLSLANGWFFEYASRIFPWDKVPTKRAVFGVIGSIVLTMILLVILRAGLHLYYENNLGQLFNKENRLFYVSGLIITLIVSMTIHAIGFFKETQKQKIINEKLSKEKVASELNALRAHVDPHFLFNSFNVLSGLIDENPGRAQEFLSGLSNIYRYILEHRKDSTSTIEEELKFAQEYMHLQKMRFEEGIQLKTNIPEHLLQKKIPSLSLQLLLENAIKHNGFDTEYPLKITIENVDNYLVVKNNMKTRKNITKSNGMGLENIRDRYNLLSSQNIEIDSKQNYFTVKLPLI